MFTVIAEEENTLDTRTHVFFAKNEQQAFKLAQEIALEDGVPALVLALVTRVCPEDILPLTDMPQSVTIAKSVDSYYYQ